MNCLVNTWQFVLIYHRMYLCNNTVFKNYYLEKFKTILFRL